MCIDDIKQANYQLVSFDSLINSQNEFEGKYIELEGYLNWAFEHVGLFKLKNKSYKAGAVFPEIEDTIAKQIDIYYPSGIRGKISIKGVFNRSHDRFGFFGELKKVTCIEIK